VRDDLPHLTHRLNPVVVVLQVDFEDFEGFFDIHRQLQLDAQTGAQQDGPTGAQECIQQLECCILKEMRRSAELKPNLFKNIPQ